MKRFQQFIKETVPTVHANVAGAQGGFGSAGTNALGNAGYDPKLFKDPVDDDLLSQDYQTPGQSGLAKWRFSTIWPVSHLTMSGIDDMVNASNQYVDLMDKNTEARIQKNFARFMGEAKEAKKCPDGQYWCYTDKKCKKIPRGYHIGRSGYLAHDRKNGNGNGSNNGNGNGNGHSGNGNGGNGNGGGGNGGGE
jgi:hypothetical protein